MELINNSNEKRNHYVYDFIMNVKSICEVKQQKWVYKN